MPKVIGVFSVKGGVGKTTIAVNLASAMAKWFGKSVIIVDTNVSSAHVGLHFNLYEDTVVTTKDVMSKKSLDSSIYSQKISNHGYVVNELKVLPCPLKGDDMFLSYQKLTGLINRLRQHFEYIIVDTAPGIEDSMKIAANSVDEAVIVATPDIPTITDTLKTVEILRDSGKKVLGIVLNKVKKKHYEVSAQEVASTCNVDVIAKLRDDKNVQESIAKGIPAVIHYPKSSFSKSVKRLTSYVLGEYYVEAGPWQRIRNFFSTKPAASLPQSLEQPIKEPVVKRRKERARTESRARKKEAEEEPKEETEEEIKKDLREELKKEIISKVKERLKEKDVE